MKVLLLNPPAYDYRLEWAKWHQPIGLLKIGAFLRAHEVDVKLLDCLHYTTKQITRRLLSTEIIENYKFKKWRFGLPDSTVRRLLRSMKQEWSPDLVVISSLNSVWWKGVRDIVNDVRRIFPVARIIIGGVYPTVYKDHAKTNVDADLAIAGDFQDALEFAPDLTLYEVSPTYAGIQFYDYSNPASQPQPRPIEQVASEIEEKSHQGVYKFAFFDSEIRLDDHDDFCILLDEIAKLDLRQRMISLTGNVSPCFITQDVASRLNEAQVKNVFFQCGVSYQNPTSINYTDRYKDYEQAVHLLEQNGFHSRTGTITAMLVAGHPFENLEAITERAMELAHLTGSVIIVPYQYSPLNPSHPLIERAKSQNGHFAPDMWNSKLFPLARLSGKKLEDYIELLRLIRLLNNKYRSKTFDFLGDSFVAELLRKSIRQSGYDPFYNSNDPTIDSIQLPVHSL